MTTPGGRLFRRPLSLASLSPVSRRVLSMAVALIVLSVSGCSFPTKVRSMFGGELPFYVTVASDANENRAVAVDAVVVYNKTVLDQLMKLKASEWFEAKKQFRNDHGDAIHVREWEWIPNQVVPEQTIEYRAGAQKVVLFAVYATDGVHRLAVDPQQSFLLVLDRLDLEVKPK
jgi:type VI secretion system protein